MNLKLEMLLADVPDFKFLILRICPTSRELIRDAVCLVFYRHTSELGIY